MNYPLSDIDADATQLPTAANNMTVVPDIFDEFEAYRFSDDPEFRVSSMPWSNTGSIIGGMATDKVVTGWITDCDRCYSWKREISRSDRRDDRSSAMVLLH